MSTLLEELFEYVELDDADRARLHALHPILAPHFPAIAERFYAAAMANPTTVERQRAALIEWMATGLLGPYDEAFYARRSRIGLPHEHMFSAMTVIRTAYLERVEALCPPAEAWASARSLHKLLDIELAIMARHYHLDTETRIQADRIAALRTMSVGLAHEVRNPLHSARLQLELLERRLRRLGDDPDLVGPSHLAQHEIERVTALLNDFLTFARPAELHAEDTDVAAIMRSVIDLERVSAERRGADLALIAPPSLIARVDSPKLHQVALNLVRNAIEAVARGGHVSVELADRGDGFALRIQDDGAGIPEHLRQRIYEPFFSTKEGGTGLGMSIVHSLIALHGGSITLATDTAGTCFDVSIPR